MKISFSNAQSVKPDHGAMQLQLQIQKFNQGKIYGEENVRNAFSSVGAQNIELSVKSYYVQDGKTPPPGIYYEDYSLTFTYNGKQYSLFHTFKPTLGGDIDSNESPVTEQSANSNSAKIDGNGIAQALETGSIAVNQKSAQTKVMSSDDVLAFFEKNR